MLFCTFLAPFFKRWSDKKVHKTKNVGKSHISIPRTKGFDITFQFQPLDLLISLSMDQL